MANPELSPIVISQLEDTPEVFHHEGETNIDPLEVVLIEGEERTVTPDKKVLYWDYVVTLID